MCRLLGGQRLLICTTASSLSSTNDTSTGAGTQLVIIKVLSSPLAHYFLTELEFQDHLNFSGLGGLSALAGENDPRSRQFAISHPLCQIRFGPRYFPLVEAYSPNWRESTLSLATSLGFAVRWQHSPYLSAAGRV